MTLNDQISRLEKQVRDLGEALELVKAPPKVKVDESAYPALSELRATLALADAQGKQAEQIQQLEATIAEQQAELKRLKAIRDEKYQRINELKRRQAPILERYEELANSATLEIQKLIGLSQLIADAEKGLVNNPTSLLGSFYIEFGSQQLQITLADGRVRFSPKQRAIQGDFRSLVQESEEE